MIFPSQAGQHVDQTAAPEIDALMAAADFANKMLQQPVGLWHRRLRNDRDGPFFTCFLPHSPTMRRRIRQKLRSSGPLLAIDDQSPTGCQARKKPDSKPPIQKD
ncbi:MAG: hypothetical protein COZ24_10850 [Hydrogenophilales bacterium CG_4_10_14_3_um_filter_63_21]|nr:MAG: hypothetical protein COZ24_10850 [Hydrogenophilales bacterium CG_4_10_14_3_um_filter_63_21]